MKDKVFEERNPYSNPAVREALQRIIEEGKDALTRTPEAVQDNVDALADALQQAMALPGTEIRLTYKTIAQATCAWTWMVAAVKQHDVMDTEMSSAHDVELKNGSGIMFWTDENRGDG